MKKNLSKILSYKQKDEIPKKNGIIFQMRMGFNIFKRVMNEFYEKNHLKIKNLSLRMTN